MRLEIERSPRLPPLAWSARVRKGGVVLVRAGEGVETRDEGFLEGAWDGLFSEFAFDRAENLVGSGARLRGDAIVFATPFHPLERIFAARGTDELIVSNSLTFALVEAKDQLDLAYPDYFFDLLRENRNGVAGPPLRLPTASGGVVESYRVANLEVNADLDLHRHAKPLGSPPQSYEDYERLLLSAVERVAENASARERQRTYRLIAACSKGYDSTAAAALAARAGCREGITFSQSGREVVHSLSTTQKQFIDDSGAECLRALGMSVTEYGRKDYLRLPGSPEAQFYFSPFAGTDTAMIALEPQLSGSLLLSGWHGERLWGVGAPWAPNSPRSRRDFRALDDTSLSGHTLIEYRLRAGFLHFPVPYVGGRHAEAIFRITGSLEMRPWTLGRGFYDRPIARRLAEEAGVPREAFGVEKVGGSNKGGLGPESAKDFAEFLRSAVPLQALESLRPGPWSKRSRGHLLTKFLRRNTAHLVLAPTVLNLLQVDRLHGLWRSVHLYEFHWGFDRTRERYS